MAALNSSAFLSMSWLEGVFKRKEITGLVSPLTFLNPESNLGILRDICPTPGSLRWSSGSWGGGLWTWFLNPHFHVLYPILKLELWGTFSKYGHPPFYARYISSPGLLGCGSHWTSNPPLQSCSQGDLATGLSSNCSFCLHNQCTLHTEWKWVTLYGQHRYCKW